MRWSPLPRRIDCRGAAAIGLDDVDPATAADYLEQVQCDPPPERWRELINRLRYEPTDPLARALNSPLTLTLVRDTYREGDSVGELLDFCDATDNISPEAVEDYLLDRVLPQAYRTRPGHPPPRYRLTTAHHTLGLIASRLRQDSPDPHEPSRDLAWWRIPTWTPILPVALTIGATTGLAIWLGFGLLDGAVWRTFFGPLVGLSGGLGGALGAWLASKKTLQTAPTRWRLMFSGPSWMFVAGAGFGFLFAFDVVRIIPGGLLIGLSYGLVTGLAIWLLVGLVILLTGHARNRAALERWRSIHLPPVMVGLGLGFVAASQMSYLHSLALYLADMLVGLCVLGAGLWIGLESPGRDSVTPPLPPFDSWRQHRVTGLSIWLIAGGLVGGVLVRDVIRAWSQLLGDATFRPSLPVFLGIALLSGLVLGLMFPKTWTTSLACAQLAIRRNTPIQLMRFLEDARERSVLSADGSIYHFRYSRLQNRLANEANGLSPQALGSATHPMAYPTPSTSEAPDSQ
jgi:hypothetical protein